MATKPTVAFLPAKDEDEAEARREQRQVVVVASKWTTEQPPAPCAARTKPPWSTEYTRHTGKKVLLAHVYVMVPGEGHLNVASRPASVMQFRLRTTFLSGHVSVSTTVSAAR